MPKVLKSHFRKPTQEKILKVYFRLDWHAEHCFREGTKAKYAIFPRLTAKARKQLHTLAIAIGINTLVVGESLSQSNSDDTVGVMSTDASQIHRLCRRLSQTMGPVKYTAGQITATS